MFQRPEKIVCRQSLVRSKTILRPICEVWVFFKHSISLFLGKRTFNAEDLHQLFGRFVSNNFRHRFSC